MGTVSLRATSRFTSRSTFHRILLAQRVPFRVCYGIGQPDDFHVTTCKDLRANAFVSADRRLLRSRRGQHKPLVVITYYKLQ